MLSCGYIGAMGNENSACCVQKEKFDDVKLQKDGASFSSIASLFLESLQGFGLLHIMDS